MNMRAEPLVVVGAGIGGLAAALFLSRAGHSVALIEKRTRVEEEGAGLQLSPNASRILIDAGLGPALSRRASAPERIRIRRARDAREIATIPLGQSIKERHGAPYFVIHRADLAGLLLDAVRAEPRIQLLYGREAQASVERDGGIALSWRSERGASGVLQACALIAADGLRSPHGATEAPPRFSGFCAWRALVPAAAVPEVARIGEVGLWLGPRAHLVHYPLKNGAVVNLVAVIEERHAEEGWSREGDPRLIGEAVADWSSNARALIASASEWRCWSLFDRKPARRWGKGPMTLLGDAAHPMLPFLAQGAAMAIEDAATLARNLAPLASTHALSKQAKATTEEGHSPSSEAAFRPRDMADALRRYERARAARTARAQREARRNIFAYHARGPFAVARDQILSRSSGEKLLARYDWLYGWRAEQGMRER